LKSRQKSDTSLAIAVEARYPGNYGVIPRTLLPGELGGDGDALDVLVLGELAERLNICIFELL
jgi:inorganic pyrophosphatase